jgi:hypothetical protein
MGPSARNILSDGVYFAFWTIESFKGGVSLGVVTAWAVVQIAEME